MDSYWTVTDEHDTPLGVDEYDLRTPEELVRRSLLRWSSPGATVLDPFAGYGTTLAVAAALDREPYGIEYEPDRVQYVRERLADPDRIEQGDLLETSLAWLPTCECCFTSPPFMEQTDTRNPFENYAGTSSYGAYLDDIERAFGRLQSVLAPGGTVLVDIVNMRHDGQVTPLAWDVADRLATQYSFEGEQVIVWDGTGETADGRYGYGFDHSYLLVFSVPE